MPFSSRVDVCFTLALVLAHLFSLYDRQLQGNPLTSNRAILHEMAFNGRLLLRFGLPQQIRGQPSRAALLNMMGRLRRVHQVIRPIIRPMMAVYESARVPCFDLLHPIGPTSWRREPHIRRLGLRNVPITTEFLSLLMRTNRFARLSANWVPVSDVEEIVHTFQYPADHRLNAADIELYMANNAAIETFIGIHAHTMYRHGEQFVSGFNLNHNDPTGPFGDLVSSSGRQMDGALAFIWATQTAYSINCDSYGLNDGGVPVIQDRFRIPNHHMLVRLLLSFIAGNFDFWAGVRVQLLARRHFNNGPALHILIEHPQQRYEHFRDMIMRILAELRLLFD